MSSRSAPVAPATPQPIAQPQPVKEPSLGVNHQTASATPTSWTRNQIITLLATLATCAFQIVWTCIDASAHPSFHTDQGFTPKFIIELVFYVLYTLGTWWLILFFFSLRAIRKNQPSAVIVAGALQLLLIDVSIFNNNPVGNPLPILCLLTTGGAAIATTLMNQHRPFPWSWPVTLGIAMNLFVLVSMLHRLTRSVLYVFNNGAFIDTAVGFWLVPSPTNEFPGTPYGLGILFTIIIATFSAVALRFGYHPSRRSTFVKLCGIGPMLITLYNIYFLTVFGMTGTSIIAAHGFTSIGQGTHPHAAFRAWVSSILLGVIAVGITVVLHRYTSARGRNPGMPVVAATQPQRYSYYPNTR